MSGHPDPAKLELPPPAPAAEDYLRRALAAEGAGEVRPLEAAARAWLVTAAARAAAGPLVVVVESTLAQDLLWQDLQTLGVAGAAWKLPAKNVEAVHGVAGRPALEVLGARLSAWQRCRNWPPGGILIASIQALLEPAPDPERLQAFSETLRIGQPCSLDALCARLAAAGYSFEAEVLARGQASRRGGLLDLWPPTEEWPVRLDFFGSTLESLRAFDPVAQRSVGRIETLALAPATESWDSAAPAAAADFFPPNTAFVWFDPEAIGHHFAMTLELMGRKAEVSRAREYDNWRLELARRFSGGGRLDVGGGDLGFDLGVGPCAGLAGLSDRVVPLDVLERERRRWVETLQRRGAEGWRVELFFETDAGIRRFRETYGSPAGFVFRRGALSGGFELPWARWLAAAEADFYGLRRARPVRRPTAAAAADLTGERLADWTDLRPGELVVHVAHGIGKYLGLYEILMEGRLQEVLAVEYAGGSRLYVPTDQTHLLSRYIGVGRTRPPLHALGGRRWPREKAAAERAVGDLAAQMLETQARRAALPGHAFGPDTPWQYDFEQSFPFVETEDQLRAIAEVKRDMESPRPMDRLICGDAGYGKTEVALRAAFKAVMDGKQVAVLVPTTVLAQQHYETFLDRMSRFPVAVEMLSRFRSRSEQAAVLERLRRKQVDIVISTHRLLQPDVRFADLGLVIIDEEQRFGVAAKEHLKRLRAQVDVLTLSATPIPRTLYLSLTGARDLSLVQTPPRERLPIETFVAQDSDELIREAVLREVNRGGQVFILHNRIQTIPAMRRRLERLFPRLRIGVGHGRMSEKTLAEVMHRFVRGEYDILLCTTIIESGVDIPNVNTILIDRADRFGMAELYQLRGRVGRSKHQAYAYLLLPRHGGLFAAARQRIQALKRHTHLGAGFKLALRDLEIRGAGNVLGTAQSGHIAAVGFELYCQLLNRTIARLKGEPERPVIDVQIHFDFLDLSPEAERADRAAVIPRDYLEDENQRIGMYRKVAGAAFEREVDALAEEFRDRFGPPPAPVRRLLAIARLRILAAGLGLKSVATDGDRLLLGKGRDEFLMVRGRHIRLHEHGVDERLAEIEKRLRQLGGSRKP